MMLNISVALYQYIALPFSLVRMLSACLCSHCMYGLESSLVHHYSSIPSEQQLEAEYSVDPQLGLEGHWGKAELAEPGSRSYLCLYALRQAPRSSQAYCGAAAPVFLHKGGTTHEGSEKNPHQG